MKASTLFCFASAFLSVPTFGIISFLSEDPTRPDEYAESDLRTMFALITAHVAAGRQVTIAAPSTIASPPLGTAFNFLTDLRDPNNNWIDEVTGLEYYYGIEGRLQNIEVVLGSIHVVGFQASEEIYEGGWTSSVNMTIRIVDLDLTGIINCNGTWRTHTLDIQEGYFFGYYSNVEINYQTRISLVARAGQGILGPSIGQSVITLNRLTTVSNEIVSRDSQTLFNWIPEEHGDGDNVNEMGHRVLSSVLRLSSSRMDFLFRLALNDRLYVAPQTSLVIAAANASGYSCRKRRYRDKRQTKLYD